MVAIISVLVGITVSSLANIQATSLMGAGNTVAGTVALARQSSISEDAFTAIVVQKTGADPYRTYCLIQLRRDPTTGSFSSSTWQLLSPWRHLGTGLIFDPAATVTSNFLASTGSLMGAQANIAYQGQTVDLTNANSAVFAVFRPDGTMDETQPVRLRLVRGSWNSTSQSVTYQGPRTSSVAENYYDILFLPDTGQTKIELP